MVYQVLQNNWNEIVGNEFKMNYFKSLSQFLEEEYQNELIYPERNEIFNALNYTDYHDVKVIILGQDPYHGPGQAHGLSFSVKPGEKIPPSLLNIYKELNADIGCEIPSHGYLKKWADQGVLLLNTVLTVRSGQAHSHRDQGWETFTDKVISSLNKREKPVVFILWGRPAQSKMKWIDREKHYILSSPHPSPLSAHRGFFGSKPFSKVNDLLRKMGEKEIDWQIEDR
ncbi:uracil-DNA glycosylase [Cytobacillus sp. FJAT-54145]|uniref:Uracil-DNA glycosylase n=1 Tax=Cytobacillus spartinae TaxID=3299023 RepID=A0ABW6KCE4_9BACI